MRLLIALLLLGCTTVDPAVVAPAPEALSAAEVLRFLRGRDLFLNETFGGNGRTCSSCHLRRDLEDSFDLTPAQAQAIFAEDPTDPLFRAIDAEGGAGSDFTTLRNHALVRIPFVLPPNVTVDEPDGPTIRTNPDGTRTVFVLRSTPTIESIALEESLMWDGREGADLAHQAGSAVQTHYQPVFLPTSAQRSDIAFFQQQFFQTLRLRIFAAGGPAPTLPIPPASDIAATKGRDFFLDRRVAPGLPRGGQCATCHSGPMLDTTNAFNPVQPPGQHISSNFVSEQNVENAPGTPGGFVFPPGTRFGIALPELTYRFTSPELTVMPAGIAEFPFPIPPGTPLFAPGTVFTLRSSDPGRILTTGRPCELALDCLLASNTAGTFSTVTPFRVSSLWASADTAPYFHNNSADTIEEVLEHYRALFGLTALATGNPAWIITPEEETWIAAYMRFAFRRTTPL